MKTILINKDLLTITGEENLIVQQTNCTSINGRCQGLAKDITERWPHIIPYQRKEVAKMGSIQIFASKDESPTVCCLNTQMFVGWKQATEDYAIRHMAFRMSLKKLTHWLETANIKAIYFPDRIGCGLAKGSWEVYLALLDEFAARIPIPCYRCLL